jgi:outer membrane receptor protein involved in Fe transport
MSRPLSRALVACAVPFLLAAAPAAGAALAGRLVLPGGEPAAGYLVSVVGQSATVPCGADGEFRLDPAPEPPFWLVASGPDGEVSAPFEVTALTAEPLTLELPPVVRDAVTIVTGVAPTLETSPANAATVVSREELEQRAPQRLYQVLESVAGAGKLGEGADSVPMIRGLSRGRTLILLDGARVSAERRAGPSGSFIDPESLGSVEVLRGPGSVVYGSDAFGGVINAVTRDPEGEGFSLRFGLEGGFAAFDQQAAYLAASGEVGGGGLLVDGHWRSADDAEAGRGIPIANSALDGWGAGVRYVHDLGPGRVRLALLVDRVEDLGKAAIDSASIRAFYPEEESDRLVASWLGTPGGGWESLEALLAYDEYHVILDRDRVPSATSNRRIDRADTDARDAALRWVGARQAGGGRLRLGVDTYSRFEVHAITGRVDYDADAVTVSRVTNTVSIDDARQLTTGAFATWARPLGSRLSLDVGLRGDRIESDNRGGFFGDRSQSHDALSGSLALSWSVAPGWTTTAQAARGFRAPTLSDRYFRGPSGRGFVTGNPDLDPERSLQLDVATRYTRDRTSVGFYAYRYEIDDLIERFGEGADFFFRNRGDATLEGFEVEAQTAFGERWSGDLGVAWADGETDGGAEIDDITPPNGWLTARWAIAQGYLMGRVTRFLEHDEPGPTELVRPGYTLWDVGAGWRFTEEVELRAIVRNLGDEAYYGAPDNAADRSPGRSVTVSLSGRV